MTQYSFFWTLLLIFYARLVCSFYPRLAKHGKLETSVCVASSLQEPPTPEVGEASESVDNAVKLGKSVAIFYPAEFNISATNPFGEAVTGIDAAVSELKHLVRDRRGELRYSDFLKCRIEYLVKVLKNSYVPSFTVEFMNLAMAGEWVHGYSNVLLRRADESLTCAITQKIIPVNSTLGVEGVGDKARLGEVNHANKGCIVNEVAWRVVDNKNQLNEGVLSVHSNYTIESNGALSLELGEHVVNAVKLTVEPMDLVMAIQRSIPLQFFDPSDSMAKDVYIDPELRISETSGPIFQGVYDIFLRPEEMQGAEGGGRDEAEGDREGEGPRSGQGFGKAKLRPKSK